MTASRSGYIAAVEILRDGGCGKVVAIWNKFPITKAEIDDDELWLEGQDGFEPQSPGDFAGTGVHGNLVVLADSVSDLDRMLVPQVLAQGELLTSKSYMHGINVMAASVRSATVSIM